MGPEMVIKHILGYNNNGSTPWSGPPGTNSPQSSLLLSRWESSWRKLRSIPLTAEQSLHKDMRLRHRGPHLCVGTESCNLSLSNMVSFYIGTQDLQTSAPAPARMRLNFGKAGLAVKPHGVFG